MREERRVKRMARALPLPPRLKNNKKKHENLGRTKKADKERWTRKWPNCLYFAQKYVQEVVFGIMKNHENDEKSRKIKNKTRRSGPIRKQQKISQARKRGLCLRNRRKSKKNKNTKKSFFFFFCFFGTSPPNPSNNQLQKYLSLRSAYGAYFCSWLFEGLGGL